jgi:16S rRNA A1518/A1519 N6-dimethyltransferase RsmA/KsgA/DIM1 with predicted DNA glycosylase/AP lyase activity
MNLRAVASTQRWRAVIVTAGFGQRRKTLSNTLKPFLSAVEITAIGIDPKRRAKAETRLSTGIFKQFRFGIAVVWTLSDNDVHSKYRHFN